MDTNLVTQLLAKLAAQEAGGQTIPLVVAMIIWALGPVLQAISLFVTRKSEATVEKIYHTVNSERTEMLTALKTMNDENKRLSSDNAKLQEHERGRDVAEALKTNPPTTGSNQTKT